MSHAVVVRNLQKGFNKKLVIYLPEFSIQEGEFVIIEGPSGSGKSTLLSLIGLLEKPDGGQIDLFENKDVKAYTRKSQKLLHDEIGWLFQNYALVEDKDVKFNLDMVLGEKDKKIRPKRMKQVLALVGLPDRLKAKISELSGGEQQRVAVARLLLKSCRLILADEPTGNLDKKNAAQIMSLLKKLQENGKTIVVVSHDRSFDSYADRVVSLHKLDPSDPNAVSITV